MHIAHAYTSQRVKTRFLAAPWNSTFAQVMKLGCDDILFSLKRETSVRRFRQPLLFYAKLRVNTLASTW